MDPTDISRPIKVIAKHGDDLRQDMLTLQMLALMDKVNANYIIIIILLFRPRVCFGRSSQSPTIGTTILLSIIEYYHGIILPSVTDVECPGFGPTDHPLWLYLYWQ